MKELGRQIRLKSGERRRSCCCKDYQWPYSGGIFGAGSGDLVNPSDLI